MAGASSRVLLRPKRNAFNCLQLNPRAYWLSSLAVDTSFPDPSPSQLLRFALTKPKTHDAVETSDPQLCDQIIALLDSKWSSGNPPPPLWYALKGIHTNKKTEAYRLRSVKDISSLHTVIERLVVDRKGLSLFSRECRAGIFQRCEESNTYAEIISTLCDITTRIQRLGLPLTPTICEMGMYYAALNVSTPAFQQFLGCYQSIDGRSFDLGSHSWIIEALSEAISSALFARPNLDTRFLLGDLTGEKKPPSKDQPTLNDIVHEVEIKNRPAWTTYLHLLSTLRSRQTLLKSWVEFLDTFSFTNQTHCHLAYSVIVSLIRSGQSGKAAKYLEEVSQRCGDNLPFISSLPSLRVLVDDPIIAETLPSLVQGTDYELLLETCLGNIEQRLGIQWQDVPSSPNKGQAHISVTAGSQWMVFDEQPLLTIDGDCAGYDDPSRLYPEIQARGCSKSRKDLHQIVDLLNEYDGTAQPVTVKLDHSRIGLSPSISLHEFQWCPQHSPLEFSDSPLSLLADDRHAGRTSTALGLLRARAMANGVPQDEHRSLHLMQLGTLSMRDGPGEKWLPSGYIVAWDRRLGEMIALYVGKSHGVIDNGPTPPNPPFGAVLDIRSTMMPNAQQWGADQRSRSLANSYYLDIDPSPDLEHLDPR